MAHWDTWESRVRYIETQSGLSRRALSLAAGLSASTIGNTLRREQRGEPVSFDGPTIAKIAKAGSVDAGWFATGQGKPDVEYEPEIQPSGAADTQAIGEVTNVDVTCPEPGIGEEFQSVTNGKYDWSNNGHAGTGLLSFRVLDESGATYCQTGVIWSRDRPGGDLCS